MTTSKIIAIDGPAASGKELWHVSWPMLLISRTWTQGRFIAPLAMRCYRWAVILKMKLMRWQAVKF